MRFMLESKIHRATVANSDLHCEGSLEKLPKKSRYTKIEFQYKRDNNL
jgi:aspartate 1-decarboxylase